ncbi:hypothetical protein PR048_011836 [Dryococelus australis]|uniref:Uncharacterized protein n=1 Tax=Dryococelus australis TaxID=614101 RepID=A0ABQ9HP02_9NEOP|nr:hypothetical protein PR048_011836 [Dryococelus australis]
MSKVKILLPPPLNPHPTILSGNRGADGCCRFVRCPSEYISILGIAHLYKSAVGGRRITTRFRGRDGVVVRLLASLQGELLSLPGGVAPGFSHVGIVPDDAAGRRVFTGISRFRRPFIPAQLHIDRCRRDISFGMKISPLVHRSRKIRHPEMFRPRPKWRPVAAGPHSHPCACGRPLARRDIRALQNSDRGYRHFVIQAMGPEACNYALKEFKGVQNLDEKKTPHTINDVVMRLLLRADESERSLQTEQHRNQMRLQGEIPEKAAARRALWSGTTPTCENPGATPRESSATWWLPHTCNTRCLDEQRPERPRAFDVLGGRLVADDTPSPWPSTAAGFNTSDSAPDVLSSAGAAGVLSAGRFRCMGTVGTSPVTSPAY